VIAWFQKAVTEGALDEICASDNDSDEVVGNCTPPEVPRTASGFPAEAKHHRRPKTAPSKTRRWLRRLFHANKLLTAAEVGDLETIRTQFDSGAYSNSPYESKTLLLAADKGHGEIVRLLLERGVDTEARDVTGRTVLHIAAAGANEEIVRLLLVHGANKETVLNPNSIPNPINSVPNPINYYFGDTTLHVAAKLGHEAIVRLLLEHGANIKAKSSLERMALHLAAENGHEAVVRLLLERGANTEARTKDLNEPKALHLVVERGHQKLVKLLLEHGANINAMIASGETALHLAAKYGHEEIIRLLLVHGADKEAKPNANFYNSNANLYKPEVNIYNPACTALHVAAISGHEAIVRLLLENGANIEAKTIDGQTALHVAAVSGQGEVVWLLLNFGAEKGCHECEGTEAYRSSSGLGGPSFVGRASGGFRRIDTELCQRVKSSDR